MMQKFFTNAIVVTAVSLSLSGFALPPQAKSEPTRKSCEAAIADGRGRLEKGRDITVTTDIADESEIYPNHPNGRPLFVTIIVDGNAADSVMTSPVFQKAIASEIIKSCGSVGAVTFGRQATDWSITFGVMSGGTIESFECIDPNSRGRHNLLGTTSVFMRSRRQRERCCQVLSQRKQSPFCIP
jgi:hypothetical protein